MFTQCFGKIITSFVSDKGKTEEGKEKRQTQTDKLRIKAKPCLNTREVCFRKCSQCWTMPVLWALEMGSNPRAFPSSPSSPSCVSALWERRGPEDGHRAVLSEPHPAKPLHRAGLPVSLYTPGSPLFTERHAGKFISRQTLSGVCECECVFGNSTITTSDSTRPQTPSELFIYIFSLVTKRSTKLVIDELKMLKCFSVFVAFWGYFRTNVWSDLWFCLFTNAPSAGRKV